MLVQMLPDFGLSEWILFFVKIMASIGAAIVGWFVCDPLTRLVYRITARAKTPSWLLPWTKMAGAITLAVVVWFIISSLGGGGAGLGLGPGLGGGPGKGAGKGGDKSIVSIGSSKDGKATENDTRKKAVIQSETVIEILGGKRLQDEGNFRYYLVKGEKRAFTLEELDDFFKSNHEKIWVNIVQTDDSFVSNTEEDPTRQLRLLTSKYGILIREPKSNRNGPTP